MAILTYPDAGVLITARRSKSRTEAAQALAIMRDPNRKFVVSDFLQLEVLPHAVHYRHTVEQVFYEVVIAGAAIHIHASKSLLDNALRLACAYDLSGLDACHLAAALEAGATEFITTERATKPLYRVNTPQAAIQVVHFQSVYTLQEKEFTTEAHRGAQRKP